MPSYNDKPASNKGSFNARDFASVATNTAVSSSAWAAAATVLELYAAGADHVISVEDGVKVWLVQTCFFLLIKIIAAILRNEGDSKFRTIAVIAWERFMQAVRNGLLDKLFPKQQSEADLADEEDSDPPIKKRRFFRLFD